ncbi:hypothetical protein D3C71_1596910 [compost metagenome]
MTAGSLLMLSWRLTTVCRPSTTWLAATTGSTAFHGDEPWPPRPSTRILRLSDPAISGPLR